MREPAVMSSPEGCRRRGSLSRRGLEREKNEK